MSAAVILAAGAGRRLGVVAKAALRLADQRTYLQAVRDTGQAAGVCAWLVVVGPPHEQVTSQLARELGLPVAHNPAPERGMASSVALGFARALTDFRDHDAALLWPVDHPLVTPDSVRAILAHSWRHGALIPTYGGRGGHPSAFGRDLWPDLARCHELPEGARSLLRALQSPTADPSGPERVRRLPIDDTGLRLDIDTPQSLAQAATAPTSHPQS